MQDKPSRVSVDLGAYPDLIVVYLGFYVSTWRGLAAMLGLGRQINAVARDKPDGLLAHEPIFYGFRHIGMRQYWRDFESLEAFTRSEPHRTWWQRFGQKNGGAGIWHETYRRSGGMEGIYSGMPQPIGLASFAAARAPDGPFLSSRGRLAA